MIRGHRLKEIIDTHEFIEKVRYYTKKDISCSPHTFFRLSEKQRLVFKCEDIKHIILNEIPIQAGLQYNGNYAIIYKHEKQKFIRIIMDINLTNINIITFYMLDKIPILKK